VLLRLDYIRDGRYLGLLMPFCSGEELSFLMPLKEFQICLSWFSLSQLCHHFQHTIFTARQLK